MMRSPKRFPVPLVHINETNSTNKYLQTLCARQQTEEFTTGVADFQTSGRGQRGNGLVYTSPSPRDRTRPRMPSYA